MDNHFSAIVENADYAYIGSEQLLEGNFFDDIDRWKTSNQDHSIQKFKSNILSDEEYERVNSCITTMKKTEDFSEYAKAFARFCYFCHIVPRGVILKKYDLKKSKEPNRNQLYVEYSYNTKKITLPEGTILYHMSSVDGIKALNPVFRGKSAKGFMYDKPRVYFTIRKNMPRFLADYKMNEKLHMYVCEAPIKQVYVDPLVWSGIQGAVYVESNNPIPVKQIETNMIKNILDNIKNKDGTVEESADFNFDHFFQFVTENGLTIDDSSNIFDSLTIV